MKKDMFGKGFAKAMAAAAAAGAAGAAAMSAGAGLAGEAQRGENSINITTSSGGGTSSVSVTGVGGEAGTSSGVIVINGKVWIDGEAIDEAVTTHTTPSGRVYHIHRHNGRVSVTTD